ncbi:MAG: tRNA 4-thiouridine(8) synthase ThiI, partial [Candidatus Schekmanbacteria bacterium GWA2_38_9]
MSSKAVSRVVLIRYHEIGLKRGNRKLFEEQLVSNITAALKVQGFPELSSGVSRISGAIRLRLPANSKYGRQSDTINPGANLAQTLSRIFGIAHFSFATKIDANYEALERYVLKALAERGLPPKSTFGIRARRADKSFAMTSQEIAIKLGQSIIDAYQSSPTKLSVDLTHPDTAIYIELIDNQFYIFFEKQQGPGGLPVGTSAPMVCLLSGGIDSPVAAWMMAKRGAQIIAVHFHSYPQTSKQSQENVEELARVLRQWNAANKLYQIPFLEVQKHIIASGVDPKYRVILYRRAMRMIAEQIATREHARALITGESLGQVASQTIENIAVIEHGSMLPILRPLIGMDKEEIIERARQIGTFEISTRPYEDCCSF